MMMKKLVNIRSLIGIVCIVSAIALKAGPNKKLDTNIDLNIPKPSQQVISIVEPIANIVLNKSDRVKLALFNKEFATRLPAYDSDLQQLNDVYVLAALYSFENSMQGKYEDLDTKLVSLIRSVTSDENHKLTNEEKSKISEYFLGLSFLLNNK